MCLGGIAIVLAIVMSLTSVIVHRQWHGLIKGNSEGTDIHTATTGNLAVALLRQYKNCATLDHFLGIV